MPVQEGLKTKIWYDALTGKHLRYGVAIAKSLRRRGNEVIITTRKHPDTIPLAEFLKEEVTVVGKYDPESLFTRLKEGIRRQLSFCRIFEEDIPDIAISHGSVDQCRVAFGLGKPIISTVDTPYAEAVHRLTLPISNSIVASRAIPQRILQIYNLKAEIVHFNGVDEVAWIKNYKPSVRYDFGKPLIVVRQFEEKATYAKEKTDLTALAKKLTRLGKVVFLSRYDSKTVRGLVVPKGFVDSASLATQADLFVGIGGTITREAALQGTPAIIVKTPLIQHVNDFLIEKGFPIFKADASDVPRVAERLLGKKYDVKHLLKRLENPTEIIADIVTRFGED
jgi:predicted glycosyltransferase